MKISSLLAVVFLGLVLGMHLASAAVESLTLDDYVLDIEYDEDDVNSGETFRIEVTVTNEAGEIRSGIEVELELDNPFDKVGDDEKDIGTLTNDESRSVSFRVEVDEDADEDEYEIEITIRDAQGTDDSDDVTFEVKNDDSDLIIGEKESLPSQISADTEDVLLTLTVENIGNGDAEHVRARLELPQGMVAAGTFGLDANLGKIESGDNKEVEFYVDVEESVEEGNLPAVLILEFEEEDGDKNSKDIPFDIPVKGKAQFELIRTSLREVSLTPGSSNTLFITLGNIGADEGKETTVRVFEHSDLPLDFSQKTSLVGDLQPGEAGIASIDFEVDADADARRYLIRAQTRSITNGEVSTEDFTIPVMVNAPEERSPFTLLLGLLGFVFFLLLGVYLFMLRR